MDSKKGGRGGARQGAGRPNLGKEKRSISFYLTEEQWERLGLKARQNGHKTISTYLNYIAETKADE